jgi:hypothetical protein
VTTPLTGDGWSYVPGDGKTYTAENVPTGSSPKVKPLPR